MRNTKVRILLQARRAGLGLRKWQWVQCNYRASQVVLVVKNPPANEDRHKRCGLNPWVGKIPQRRKWQPTPVFLSGESHGQWSLMGCSPQGRTELDTTKQLSMHTQYNWDGNQGLRCICTLLVLKLKKMGFHHIIPYIFVVAYVIFCIVREMSSRANRYRNYVNQTGMKKQKTNYSMEKFCKESK